MDWLFPQLLSLGVGSRKLHVFLGLRFFLLPLAVALGSEGGVLSGEPWNVGWVVFLNVVMSCDCVEYPCP